MSKEQQIKKGFNAGYLMAKHRPGLSRQIQNGFTDKENPYALGFIAGARELARETAKSRTKNYDMGRFSRNQKPPNKEQDKDFLDK